MNWLEKTCQVELVSKISKLRVLDFFLFENEQGLVWSGWIMHQYFALHTPEQNGFSQRKNTTIQKMARTMMHAKGISLAFWSDIIHTACRSINMIIIRPKT